MTPYTHAYFGLGFANVVTSRRMPAAFWVLAGLLPTVPDFDGFSFAPYGDIWGHRGWTHSLAFALGMGVIVALATFRYFKMKFWALAAFFFLITASHGFLDACTFGGFGIPFFWPLTDKRFGGWGPVPLPIGFQWPNPWQDESVRSELLWVWLPMTALVVLVACCRWWRWWTSGKQSMKQALRR
jgi:inner membrane protein